MNGYDNENENNSNITEFSSFRYNYYGDTDTQDNATYDDSYNTAGPTDSYDDYNNDYTTSDNGDYNNGFVTTDNYNYDAQPSLNLDFKAPPSGSNSSNISVNDENDASNNRQFNITNVDKNFAQSTDVTLDSLGGELTPAEIEDMKRERAAKRRKRMLREKRRRERRRQAIIRCSLLLAAVILVIVIFVKIIAGIGGLIKNSKKNNNNTTEGITTEATTTEEPVAQIDEAICAKELPATREEALEMLKVTAETDSDIKNIVENEAVYPDIMIKNLAINSELIDFALNYPAKINIPFDGDFTIDADTSEVPLFLQYDPQWGYADYGQTVLGLNGAAPACLSMAYVYLTGDGSKNPIIIGDFSMEKGYLDEEGHTDNKLMTEGAEELLLESNELDLSKENIIGALEQGNVVICSVLSGDFTKDKSYIVIKAFRNGFFYINDPTSQARSQVGWDYKRLSSQISGIWSLNRGSAPTSDSDSSVSDGTGTDTGTGDGTDTTTQADGDNSQTDNSDNTDTDATGAAE